MLPSSSHQPSQTFANARSICAGILVRKSNGAPIGRDENKKDLIAMRCNLRIPFTTKSENGLVTTFGTPEIQIQKRIKEGAATNAWEKFGGWKDFVKDYVALSEVGDLLNSPIGPLLIAKVSDPSGFEDIILKQKKRDEIKTDLQDVKKDLDAQLALLKNISDWKPPKKDATGPHSTQRKLGSLLESLGFISGKQGSGGEFEYSFKTRLRRDSMDRSRSDARRARWFPALGQRPRLRKTNRENRIALWLASQTNPVDPRRTYFGLAGLAYNILLTPAPEKSGGKELKTKDEDVKTPTITLSDDNFTDDKSILINEEEEQEGGGDEDTKTHATEDAPRAPRSAAHLGKWMSGETLDDNWYNDCCRG